MAKSEPAGGCGCVVVAYCVECRANRCVKQLHLSSGGFLTFEMECGHYREGPTSIRSTGGITIEAGANIESHDEPCSPAAVPVKHLFGVRPDGTEFHSTYCWCNDEDSGGIPGVPFSIGEERLVWRPHA